MSHTLKHHGEKSGNPGVNDCRHNDCRHLVALSCVPDIGPLTIRKLIARFGSAEAVFGMGARELESAGISRGRAEAIAGFSGWAEIGKWLEAAGKKGIDVLTYESENYPEMLKDIPDAPPVIYVRGSLNAEDRFAIGIVGTRTPTAYGLSQAERLAGELARMGFTIVSGLARGIDTAAHKGALKAGGRSFGIMGSGVDVPYPQENKGLMDMLSASGAVMSEFPLGAEPSKENFPRRNRIISGLALGVIVVEAAKGSGSLITANCALEQGREVFSIPGNINSAFSKGTNELIKRGARIVTGAEDILEELAPVLKGFLAKRPDEGGLKVQLNEDEKRLVGVMSPEPRHIDEIARELGMAMPAVSGLLLALELKGVVRQGAGKRFSIC
ncbi:MAG: DNA-processing protein DprA [Nitrospiraceae bacterium]|nr:DNA-processing protein DprA [Nitrospiraceae bacterium]